MAEQQAVRTGREVSPLAIDVVEMVVRMAQLDREVSPATKRQLIEAVTTRLERAAQAVEGELQRLRDRITWLEAEGETLRKAAISPAATEEGLPLVAAPAKQDSSKGSRGR